LKRRNYSSEEDKIARPLKMTNSKMEEGKIGFVIKKIADYSIEYKKEFLDSDSIRKSNNWFDALKFFFQHVFIKGIL
jgi:hypothetical protein